ncbi:hypothetical protein [Nocardioides hwasunensis]|uniref:DUF2510 domain-containing protein n=1 Tax=Nocardioides hwasunensis TaxID=397258 RepID=A0ABR8MEC9_9ACTN|nr:hypothetical protein [Nocardioides hwasunensis]MBD3914465.1 hypothetical protein [Nocardioides hwasunensis]
MTTSHGWKHDAETGRQRWFDGERFTQFFADEHPDAPGAREALARQSVVRSPYDQAAAHAGRPLSPPPVNGAPQQSWAPSDGSARGRSPSSRSPWLGWWMLACGLVGLLLLLGVPIVMTLAAMGR